MPNPRAAWPLIALIVLLLAAAEAGAFGTIRGLGQNAEHERITRRALTCPPGTPASGACLEPRSLAELAGENRSFGAVGIPDRGTLIADASYHCDGGDHLAVPGYPQTAAAARAALVACRARMVANLNAAVTRARGLLDPAGRIRPDQVTLGCVFVGTLPGRAKCDVIESMGLLLHTSEDFYSHSNWTDLAGQGPIGPGNPPGLGNTGPAPWIDLRGQAPFPDGLISGCFGDGPVVLPVPGVLGKPEGKYCNYGPLGLLNRVKHRDLNKDEGTIDPALVAAGTTPRGRGGNFGRAVSAAVADTSDKWATLTERLVATYGAKDGARMICALTRDDPVRDCQGRSVALVLDSSGSNTSTDPGGLRITAGLSIAEDLVGVAEAQGGASDQLAVVDFDSSARVTYPPGDPDGATAAIRAIDADGGTDIGSGIRAATGALTGAGAVSGKAGIVVLTDGQDSDPGALAAAIRAAGAAGIRVSIGFLDPGAGSLERRGRAPHQSGTRPAAVVQEAVIGTGGVFGTIRSAEEQRAFADLVEQRGLSAADDPDGAAEGGAISLGVEVAGTVAGRDVWTRAAAAGEGFRATLTTADGAPATLVLLTPDGRSIQASGSPATVSARTAAPGVVRVIVSGAGAGLYTLRLDADPAAALPPRVRTVAAAGPRVLGRARLSQVAGGPAIRTARLGRPAVLGWRLRTRGGVIRIALTGPGGRRAGARSRLRSSTAPTTRSIVATLPVLGSARGPWVVALWNGRTLVDQLVVRTR